MGDSAVRAGEQGGGGHGPVSFRGVSQLVLDAKGRLAIPSKHRDALANGDTKIVVTADPSRCLLLYPLATWEPIQAELMEFASFDERIRGVQRLLVGHADDVDIDTTGRVLIPPALRQFAGLDKRVVLVGQGRKFELWSDTAWQAQTARTITFPVDGLPPGLERFSL
ncbi:MAG TPA: division/cell wall cluster transcriptional repressor MraZ [Casimicrobiaceae bacterium]|nr:division/cell wall cluster transcriptional repressor MraZ [Casimicrobiaceae bacterium]